MSRTATPQRVRHPWGLAIGLVLVLPELVACVVVVREPLLTALFGFLLTVGVIRLGTLGYRVLRERVPSLARGWLVLVGLVAAVAGSVIWSQVRLAQPALADPDFTGAVAPLGVAGLNLAAVLTLALWLTGAVVLVCALLGLVAAGRRRS